MPLTALAEIALRRGNYVRAGALEQQSLKLRQETGDKWGIAVSLGNLAWILLRQGELKAAALRLAESLMVRREIGDRGGIAWCLEKMAEVAIATAQRESAAHSTENLQRAVQLFGAAASVRARYGATIDEVDQLAYEQQLDVLRAHFGAATFAALWAEGQAMTLERAIAEAEHIAMSEQPSDAPPPTTLPTPIELAGLTAREVEVLRLVARGLNNSEIAETLVVSIRTVDAHLRLIFAKLDVTSRTAAAHVALDHKLV